ncbi:MAG: zf-HC2 domain-containing protein [Deltaproteobacteria bacterium]
MKNILDRDEILAAYAEGNLPESEKSAVEAHLRESEAMRRSLAEIKETEMLLKRLPQVETPAGFTESVMRRIKSEAAVDSPPGIWERLFPAIRLRFAAQALAALTIVVSVAVYQAYKPAPDGIRSAGEEAALSSGKGAGERWGDVEITLAASDIERAEGLAQEIVMDLGGVVINKQLGESQYALFVVIDAERYEKLRESLRAIGTLELSGDIAEGGGNVRAKIRIIQYLAN